MPLKSNLTEAEILDFIFRQSSNMEPNEKEQNINTYYAIKYHMPKEIFQTGKLKFNYNKGLSYILASYDETTIFKLPNNKENLVEFICPPNKEFINSLDISDIKKDATLKKYKDTKHLFWYVNLTTEEVRSLASYQWETFNKLLLELSKK